MFTVFKCVLVLFSSAVNRGWTGEINEDPGVLMDTQRGSLTHDGLPTRILDPLWTPNEDPGLMMDSQRGSWTHDGHPTRILDP